MKPSESKYDRLRKFAPPFVLFLLTLIFFRNAWTHSRILLFRDLFFFHYPLRYYWITHWLHGYLPLLNDSINGGQPLLANPNYAVFYPGNLLFAIAPFNLAWNWSLTLHAYWASLGMYYWMRSWRCSVTASILAAAVFAFSGPMLSGMNYYNLLITASWMPWILLATGQAVAQGRRWIGLAAFFVSAQILAGEPTVQIMTFALQVLLCVIRLRTTRLKTIAARLLFVEVIALAISGLQIIPTLLWLPHSGRSAPLDFRTSAAYWSMPPARLIELLVPGFYGNVMSHFSKDFWGSPISDGGYPYIFCMYCGWIPLLLTPFALKSNRGRAALLLAACMLLVAMGRHLPGYATISSMLPSLQIVQYPQKFLLLFSFSLAVSAAFGLDTLRQKRDTARILRALTILSGVLILVVFSSFSVRWPFWLTETQRQMQRVHIAYAAGWLIVSAGIIVWIKARQGTLPAAALVLVLAIDLFVANHDLIQTESSAAMERVPVFLSYHPQVKETPIYHHGEDEIDLYFSGTILPERLMTQSLHPLLGLRWGIEYGATNDIDRMSWKLSEEREKWIHAHFPNAESLAEMRQAGIARVVSLSPLHDNRLQTEYFLQYKPDKFIWVYRIAPDALAPVRWQKDDSPVPWEKFSPYNLRIAVHPETPETLLILRNAIPGWRCLLDGKEAALKSSAQGWMLIDIPAGQHRLELTFFPPGLKTGLLLTAIGSIIGLRLLLLA